MILDRHYIQDHSHKLLNVYPSMCLHTLPKLPILPQFRILFFQRVKWPISSHYCKCISSPSYIKLTSWLLGTYRKTIDLVLSLFIGDDLFTLSQLGLCKDYLSLQVQITVSSPLFTALPHTVMIIQAP